MPEVIIHEEKGLSLEEIKAMYFDSDALVESPDKVYRLNSADTRFYFTFNEELFCPEYFLSVTSFIAKSMPTPDNLIRWMADLGYNEAQKQMNLRAHFGTLEHILFGEYLISKTFDLQTVKQRIIDFCEENNILKFVDVMAWENELQKDLLSFAQFCRDFNVKPLAIEVMLVSREHGISGVVDLACTMWDKRYTEKTPLDKRNTIRALIDFKAGKNGFYKSHKAQLHAYKVIWEENFPEYPIDKVYNFAGKNWRSSLGYNLEDQTEDTGAQELMYYLEIAKIQSQGPRREIPLIHGTMNWDADPKTCFEVVNIDTLITKKLSEI